MPDKLVKKVNFSTLKILKDTFVEENMKFYFSDLLFRIKIKDNNVYLYFLFKHKSHPDRLTGFQLLKYIVKIWENEIKNKKMIKKLIPIIPYVYYHGKERWNIGTHFQEIIEYDKDIAEYMVDFEYILNDLSKYKDEEIKGNVTIKVMALIMKHIFDKDIEKAIEKASIILNGYVREVNGLKFLESVLRYIYSSTEIKPDKVKVILEKQKIERGGEIAMTTAEEITNLF